MKLRAMRGGVAAACTVAGLLLAAAAAPAAQVEVRETEGEVNFTRVTLVSLIFSGAPGEDNRLSIEVLATKDAFLELKVLDAGAAVDPGNGCDGGGAPGVAATCVIRVPRSPDYVPCGVKPCLAPVPGTGVMGSMRIDLGDGDNAFDGSSFTAELSRSFEMAVTAGAGEDRILTGGGADTIDPGGGADSVHTGDGEDRVVATPAPDGPDVYDLGTEYYNPSKFGADEVDYSRRSTPVEWDGFSGVVAGEGDKLNGVENVFGGSGDDVLRGNEFENFLVGGPGDDLLVGGFNWDVLMGGEGADELRGGLHPDVLLGQEGDDSAFGGRGHDLIKCSDGWDRALRIDKDRMVRCEVQRLFSGNGLDALRPSA